MNAGKWKWMVGLCAVLSFSCEDATIQGGGSGSGGSGAQGSVTEWASAKGSPDIFEEYFGSTDPDAITMFEEEGITREPIAASWAKVLEPRTTSAIVMTEEDRVVFDASASQAVRALEPMEIISSRDEDNLFLRRVLRVEAMADGTTVVHTEDAAVTDVVLHGSFGLGDDQPPAPASGSSGFLNHQQQLEFSGYDNRRGATQKQFKLQVDSSGLAVEGEFPFGNATLVPAMQLRVTEQPQIDSAFHAQIRMTGEQRMCHFLQQSDEPHNYRTGWFNQNLETIPPEMRKLMWVLHWGGNSRTGNATVDWPRGSNTHTTFNGYVEIDDWGSNTSRAISPVQMRPEFVTALENFERRIQQEGLQEHFITDGTYLRQPPGTAARSREEIINYYRSMIPSLDPDVQDTMRRLVGILETQPDDLQWISTSLAVARDHCRGVSEQTNAAFVIKTAVSVQGSLEIKGDNDGREDGAVVNGFRRNSVTGSFRKNLFGEHYLTTLWLFPGGFPVAVSPTFTLAAVVSPPKIEGAYKMEYGPYELKLNAGYNKSSSGGEGMGQMGCDGAVDGLCGGLFAETEAGEMNITSREVRFTGTTGVSLVPEFLLKFYGVAGIGAATPIYNENKLEAIARTDLGTQEISAMGSLCLSTKNGLKVNLLGRLDNPFAVQDRTPLGEVVVPLYDSCAQEGGFIPCLKASAGFRVGGDAVSGVTYSDPVFRVGDDSCPSSLFTVEVEWDTEQDVDLYLIEPGGGLMDRDHNSQVGGERNVTEGCTISTVDRTRCISQDKPYKETATYGNTLNTVLPGDYTFYVKNATRVLPVSGKITATYVNPVGEMTTRNFVFNVGESNNYESARFTFTIPEQ